MATVNSRSLPFTRDDALMYLEHINEAVMTIGAIADAGSHLMPDNEYSTECLLFKHINEVASDAKSYWALRTMLESLGAADNGHDSPTQE